MNDESKMQKLQTWVSKHVKGALMFRSMNNKIPISRLIAIALEHELEREKPFEFDVTLPDEEYVEFAYADEAGRIMSYLRGDIQGFGLDMLCLLRHDIGIPDKQTFLLAFRELVNKEMVEAYKPTRKPLAYTDHPEGYVMYRLKGENVPERRKKRREANEFERFKRLEKKYGKK
jgi:hypothetical protein